MADPVYMLYEEVRVLLSETRVSLKRHFPDVESFKKIDNILRVYESFVTKRQPQRLNFHNMLSSILTKIADPKFDDVGFLEEMKTRKDVWIE